MLPSRLLKPRYKTDKFGNLERDGGIEPENSLSVKEISVSLLRL
jgi:hypothetical protein